MPCFELLAAQPEAARRAIIGDAKVNVGVEAAVRQSWDAIIGSDGAFVGMSTFGASAPYKELYSTSALRRKGWLTRHCASLGTSDNNLY